MTMAMVMAMVMVMGMVMGMVVVMVMVMVKNYLSCVNFPQGHLPATSLSALVV